MIDLASPAYAIDSVRDQPCYFCFQLSPLYPYHCLAPSGSESRDRSTTPQPCYPSLKSLYFVGACSCFQPAYNRQYSHIAQPVATCPVVQYTSLLLPIKCPTRHSWNRFYCSSIFSVLHYPIATYSHRTIDYGLSQTDPNWPSCKRTPRTTTTQKVNNLRAPKQHRRRPKSLVYLRKGQRLVA